MQCGGEVDECDRLVVLRVGSFVGLIGLNLSLLVKA
jgi:hypothetical protein